MQPYICQLGINSLDARAAKCRYESKASLNEYANLHSASEGSEYNSLACVIADLLLSLLQLKKQVRRADIDFYGMSADTNKQAQAINISMLTFELDLVADSEFNIA